MENGVEEENKPEKHMLIVTTPDWLDLPDPIATNIILEHLDIVDYIRFSAVCKKWQSIQKEHRIRHSPYPPLLPRTFPWLCCNICFCEQRTLHFYLTNKQKAYNIPLYEKLGTRLGYSYGWLLMFKIDEFYEWMSFCILNPVTGVQIESPMFKKMSFPDVYISSPPTDPDCTIVALDYDGNVYLCRVNDNSSLIKTDYTIHAEGNPFFCHNKIYIIDDDCEIIYMVDALLPDPIEQMIEMDCSDFCVDLPYIPYLMDFLGELIMVMVVYDMVVYDEFPSYDEFDYRSIKEFRVYRADFSTNKWMRMESLGDHALFFSYHSIFSLPAVDVGCEKNTIYFPGVLEADRVALMAFNLNTRNWIGGRPPMSHVNFNDMQHLGHHQFYSNWIWFLPTPDYYDVTKTNGACQIQLK